MEDGDEMEIGAGDASDIPPGPRVGRRGRAVRRRRLDGRGALREAGLTIRTPTILSLAAVGALAAGLGACGDDDSASAPGSAAPASPAPSRYAAARPARDRDRAAGATLTVRRTRYGTILADGRGRILRFTRDGRASRSRCYGDCAVAWPPFYARGVPKVRGAAKAGLLGTTRRRDGRVQVTYRGKPLYYYVTDTRPGEVTCQAVPEFGGTWYVTNPRRQHEPLAALSAAAHRGPPWASHGGLTVCRRRERLVDDPQRPLHRRRLQGPDTRVGTDCRGTREEQQQA